MGTHPGMVELVLSRSNRLCALGLITLALLLGCQPQRQGPLRQLRARALWPAELPSVIPAGVQHEAPFTADPGLRPPRHILALSGGGLYGAYSTGFLAGWTQSRTRPEFDVVTGVSTGALAAPFAFLGPEYDNRLEQLYTGVRAEDIFRIRTWVTIPFKDAVASSAPLMQLIESQVTPVVLERIAEEHRKGRRLYVATTNLETRRFVVWDMGAIACQNSPHACRLFRDVLLASASVPGMVPPVAFSMEVDGQSARQLHVDGGVTTPLFVPAAVFRAARTNTPEGQPVFPGANGNLYVVVAGKLYPDASSVKPHVLPILGATTEAIMYAHCRSELMSLYGQAQLAGLKYHLTALRQDLLVQVTTPMSINQCVMTRLYTEGFKDGVAGPQWRSAPPDMGPSENDRVRMGLCDRPLVAHPR